MTKKQLSIIIAIVLLFVCTSNSSIAAKKIKSKSVSMNTNSATIAVGDIITLIGYMKPTNSTDTLKWSSSSPNIASVTKYGVVTGLKPGTTTITVKTSSKKKATCKITVKSTLTKDEIDKLIQSATLSDETIKKIVEENSLSESDVKALIAKNTLSESDIKNIITKNTLSKDDVIELIKQYTTEDENFTETTIPVLNASNLPIVLKNTNTTAGGTYTVTSMKCTKAPTGNTFRPYRYTITITGKCDDTLKSILDSNRARQSLSGSVTVDFKSKSSWQNNSIYVYFYENEGAIYNTDGTVTITVQITVSFDIQKFSLPYDLEVVDTSIP